MGNKASKNKLPADRILHQQGSSYKLKVHISTDSFTESSPVRPSSCNSTSDTERLRQHNRFRDMPYGSELKKIKSCNIQPPQSSILMKGVSCDRLHRYNRVHSLNYDWTNTQSKSLPLTQLYSNNFPSHKNDIAKLSSLDKWTGLSHYQILYSSRLEELSSRVIKSVISSKCNVMVEMLTDTNDIIGCFNTSIVPCLPREEMIVPTTEFILFFIDASGKRVVLRPNKDCDMDDSLLICSNDDMDNVLEIIDAVQLRTNHTMVIKTTIPQSYSVIDGNIAMAQTANVVELQCVHVVILQWY